MTTSIQGMQNRSPYAGVQCYPCKVTLVGLGIILIIGGAAAAGVLYSHQGYTSLSCLAALPAGIALTVIGARFPLSQNPVIHSEVINTNLNQESKLNLTNIDWNQMVQTPQKLKNLFPTNRGSKHITQKKLKTLNAESLKILTPYLSGEQLQLLDNSQLNYLNWEEIVKTPEKLQNLFPVYTLTKNETQKRIRALNAESLKILTPHLSAEQLNLIID